MLQTYKLIIYSYRVKGFLIFTHRLILQPNMLVVDVEKFVSPEPGITLENSVLTRIMAGLNLIGYFLCHFRKLVFDGCKGSGWLCLSRNCGRIKYETIRHER